MAPKKFQIEEKIFKFPKKYIINDDRGNLSYYAVGKVFSPWDETTFYDSFDEEIFKFKRKIFSWKTTFFILKDGKPVYKMFAKLVEVRPTMYVESLTESDAFFIEGDLLRKEYNFYREEKKFASVSKEFFSLADIYGVEVNDNEDVQLVLAVVVIIDLIRDKKK